MSNETIKTAVPKLRFPEFRDKPEWSMPTLGEISEQVVKKIGDLSLPTVSITAGTGFVLQSEKFGRDISGEQYKRYTLLKKGEFAYNKGNSKRFPEGCIYQLKEFEQAATPNVFFSFRFKRHFFADFYQGYFDNNFHGKQLKKHITSGARSNGLLNISSKSFFSIVLPTPNDIAEQRKIADCLSLLNDLVTALSAKLLALQKHKQGLMQGLFPAEGETVPKLRFPEFYEAGDWDVKPLGKVAKNLDNKRVPITGSERTKGSIPYYGASGIIDYVQDFIFDEELLCISEDGANLIARTYPIAFSITGKTWVNNHAHVIRFEKRFTQIIVENYLNAISLEDFLTGMAQPKLNRAKLDVIPIPLPKDEEEQKKIADCLSSLNDHITAQSKQIEALKLHKKGLMQVLFPTSTESN
ncbi:restriction endonuclease subunit S [Hymenobacter amundsenii]|uniref:Restriction endonuclease subunit S n=1 Tax=Hymenobacter amundsenii TaxID=2006685 RepID=A0A246FQV2_9BACT|nr:restriction endonuclease subunit S [Hymenobacter amundsenii]OWP65069.1 restriction endonuclease subunit S [Hymenobacter amundsenii]